MDDLRKRVAKLRPIDDVFFHKIVENKEACQEMLRVFLGDDTIEVVDNVPQANFLNLQGRSVILDLFCELQDGRLCDVEVQRAEGQMNHFRRVRYNITCITANYTPKGDKLFKDVPDVVAIYLSEFDPFGEGLKVYHGDTTCRETGKKIENGVTEIYINASDDTYDGTKIAELMKCFKMPDFKHEDFPELSEMVRYFKHDEGGIQEMCKVVEDYANEKVMTRDKHLIRGMIESKCSLDQICSTFSDISKSIIAEIYEEETGEKVTL